MIIDTHTHVASSDKVKHPLDPGARGWSTEVSNDVQDLIAAMDRAGVACATLVQPNAIYGLDNFYLCSARLRRASMVAVVRATMRAREASPMAQPMSVLRIDMAPWVLHVVGIDDTGVVVLRKRLALEGHQRGRRH